MYAGGTGYHIHGMESQRDNQNAAGIERLLGRQVSAVPRRLSRVLYIPSHGSSQFHLPLYDVGTEFRTAIGDALIGSSMFTTRLNFMKTPSGEGTDGQVRYLVDVEKRQVGDGEHVIAQIRRRALGVVDGKDAVSLLMDTGSDAFKLKRGSPDSGPTDVVSVTPAYPVPDTTLRDGAVRHPWYSFTPGGSSEMQWRSYPASHGPLRHTLVRTDKSPQDPGELPHDDCVEAIYQHIGISTLDLCHRESQGVLMLLDGLDREVELLYIGSLVGMLWQVRRQSTVKDDASKSSQTKKILRKVFKK